MNKRKKYLITSAIIVAILVLTNPTNNDLKNYMHAKGLGGGGGRINYFGIFSIFEAYAGHEFQNPNRIYIGVFKNFICIKSY